MRLDQYVAQAAGESRTVARKFITKGLVTVGGIVCRKADTHIDPAAPITLQGIALSHSQFVYLMLDKPLDVVSASKDAHARTVADLAAPHYPRRTLFPAGRLDKNSTGFVLLTDDGAFAHDILAPKRHVSKTYDVLLDTPLTQNMITAFAAGITLADGKKMHPAQLTAGANGPCSVTVVLTQGVYHQIKRMFGVIGAGVNALRRTAIGPVALDESLGEGGLRELTQAELAALRQAAHPIESNEPAQSKRP